MKKTLFVSALMFALSLFSTAARAQTPDNSIVIGTIDSIESKILNEKRKIFVHVPKGENKKFPVLYVLDGDDHFHALVGMIKRLNSTENCPEMIIVGISNSNKHRSRDLTHTKADDPRWGLRNTGGGEKFSAFIEKEVMPKIEATCPTAPYRMLVGHSAGGLFAMNTLLKQPGMFNAYVSIDPGMLFDDQKLLKESKKILAESKFEGKSLFMAISNSMPQGMDTLAARSDKSFGTEMIRPILDSRDVILANTAKNGLDFAHKYYADDDHRSCAFLAEYDAIRFIFKGYKFPMKDSYMTEEGVKFASVLEEHYAKVSKQLGYKVSPDENLVNDAGYAALGAKHLEKAGDLFKLNVANHPQSANAFDSLGDYYMAIEDGANAIENFKKSLDLKEVPATREKMEKLMRKSKK